MKIKKRQKFFGGQGQLWKAKQTRLYTAADSGRMAAKQPSASTYSMAMPCSCINHALHMHWSFYSLTYVSCIGHGLVTSFFDRCEKYQKHRLAKWLRRTILGGGREPARGMEGEVVHGGGQVVRVLPHTHQQEAGQQAHCHRPPDLHRRHRGAGGLDEIDNRMMMRRKSQQAEVLAETQLSPSSKIFWKRLL